MIAPGVDRVTHWVSQSARAPSAHNVQPARWRLAGAYLELWEDPARWLAAGDPVGRDASIGLGMAWEGLRLAAGADGWQLGEPERDAAAYPPPPTPRRRARAALAPGAVADPLAAWVDSRRSCRQAFVAASADAEARLEAVFAAHAGIALRADGSALEGFAAAHQAASIDLLRDRAIGAELHAWLRLSRRHPLATRDGLDATCLGLSPLEALGGRVLMRPAVAAMVARLGLGGLLVDEARKTRTATAIAVLAVPDGVDDFEAGRRWYRFWLALAAAGFAAVPMSALVDTSRGRDALAALKAVPAGRRVVNVMRVGVAPAAPPASARLPAAELLEVAAKAA